MKVSESMVKGVWDGGRPAREQDEWAAVRATVVCDLWMGHTCLGHTTNGTIVQYNQWDNSPIQPMGHTCLRDQLGLTL